MHRRPQPCPLNVCATSWLLVFACAGSALCDEVRGAQTDRAQRTPWLSSRLVGSPEPPSPFATEPVYTETTWQRPLYAKAEPGTEALFIVVQGRDDENVSRLLRYRRSPEVAVEAILEIKGRVVYGLEFHPQYEATGEVYLFSNGPTGEPERLNRISRFTVSPTEPRVCLAESEQVVIEWRSMGHDGGDMVFGHDGMLYITSGDGTTDSDTWISAQDPRNLLGGVLRIDVLGGGHEPYRIPPDNPFLELDGARGELWAIGLRNPWRMTIDRQTGQIWVGNNGQDLWETAHLLRRGENYGWSVYEGSHPFYLSRQLGPAAVVAPTIEHHHTEFRSLTGGVVYYGEQLPELAGTYLYGDYGTGKIWGARHDGERLTFHQELADTNLLIAGFAVAPDESLLVIDYGGAIHRLVRRPPAASAGDFPRQLSKTGLFASTAELLPAAGVVPYTVNAAGWTDGARAERWLALPNDSRMKRSDSGGWNLPDGAAIVQTLFAPLAESAKWRIETRLMLKQDGEWAGYSYRWNEQQDDAVLVAKEGQEFELPVVDASGGATRQTWRIPSRTECLSCHSRAANFLLGISTLQLNRSVGTGQVNQLARFDRWELFEEPLPADLPDAHLVDPYDPSADVDGRARSYLHVNCAGCHIRAGGGNARMELAFAEPLENTNLIAEHPQHATFGIEGARLVAPGEPEKSVLYRRISLRGSGQMPPLVSRKVDEQAASLIRDWISGMPAEHPFVRDWTESDMLPLLSQLEGRGATPAGRDIYRRLGCRQCHRLSGDGGGAGPDLTGIAKRLQPPDIVAAIVDPSRKVAAEFATTIVETVNGRIYQGRVELETATQLRLRTGESFAEPLLIDKADIEDRFLSPRSTMPNGLLNTAETEELIELLAFLLNDGVVPAAD